MARCGRRYLRVRFAALEEAKKKMASLDKDKKEEAKKMKKKSRL